MKKKQLLNAVPEYVLAKVHYTPIKVAKLIAEIGRLYNPKSILDPACGTGNILFYCDYSEKIKGIDINEKIIELATSLNKHVDFEAEDSLKKAYKEKYDLIVSHFPFGRALSRGHLEKIFLEKCLSLVNENGCLICIVPNNLLFAPYCDQLRKKILNEFSLEMIVSLSKDIIPHTFVETSVLIIKRSLQREHVFLTFFDDNIEEIVNNYCKQSGELWVENSRLLHRWDRKFFDSKYDNIRERLKGENIKHLEEISLVHRGYLFRNEERKPKGKYLILTGRNIKGGSLINTDRDKYSNYKKDKSFERSIAQPGDIIINLLFENKRICLYHENNPPAVVSHNCAIIRSPNNDYIDAYLNTEEGHKLFISQAEMKSYGTTISHLTISNLRKIKIPLLPLEDPNIIADQNIPLKERYEEISKILLENLNKAGWGVRSEYHMDGHIFDLALFYEKEFVTFIEIKKPIKDKMGCEVYPQAVIDQLKLLSKKVNVKSCFLISGSIYQLIDDQLFKVNEFPSPEEFLKSKHDDDNSEFLYSTVKESSGPYVSEYIQAETLLHKFVLELVSKLKPQLNRIEFKVNRILDVIEKVQTDISLIKSENRDIEEKILLIYDCMDRKLSNFATKLKEEYRVYKEIAKNLIDNWDRLDLLSKEMIPMAEYLYSKLGELEDIDYSPAILQYCRALENEILKKLFVNFAQHIIKNVEDIDKFLEKDLSRDKNGRESKTARFARSIKKYRNESAEQFKFTFGEMLFNIQLASGRRTVQNSLLLSEFKEYMRSNFRMNFILSNEFRYELNKIVEKFRNRCAHPYKLDLEIARECKRIIPQTIDQFLESCIKY